MSSKNRRSYFLLACAIPALAWWSPALAQESAATEEDELRSAEIVVTAQQREQSIQDIPISVIAFDADTVQQAGVRDLKDVQILAPGLLVTSTTTETSTTARIRGVGTVGDNPGLESSVGISIDGVFRARNGVGFGDLGEIERIEVLRGPQGTLFGKNTSAGLISVVTAQPSFEFGANAELTISNFDGYGVSGSVTGPIFEDKLAFRLFGVRRERDGFQDVIVGPDRPTTTRTELEDGDQRFFSIRASTLYTPTDNFDLTLNFDYTRRNEDCCGAAALAPINPGVAGNAQTFATGIPSFPGTVQAPNATAAILNSLVSGSPNPADINNRATGAAVFVDVAPGIAVNPVRILEQVPTFDRIIFSNRSTDNDIEDYGFNGNINWDFGFATLTSITAYREFSSLRGQDTDFTAADLWFRPNDGNNGELFDNFSQELRLQGSTDSLDWLVGFFFSQENLERRDNLTLGADYAPYFSLLGSGGTNPAFLQGTFTSILPLLAGTGLVTPGTTLPAGGVFPLGAGVLDVYNQDATSWSFFTHNIWRPIDRVEITAGVRFTRENKEVTADFNTAPSGCAILEDAFGANPAAGVAPTAAALAANPATAPFAPTIAGLAGLVGLSCFPWTRTVLDGIGFDQERTENEVTGIARLSVDVTDNVTLYGGYSRGYKAGGFNLDRDFGFILGGNPSQIDPGETPNTEFEEEEVDAYEFGFRSRWFGGSLLANWTFFYQDFSNFQLNTFNGVSFVVTSVPELTSIGIEGDFVYLPPIKGLSLQGGFTYTDTTFGNFSAAENPTGDVVLDNQLPGAQIAFAPIWTVSGALNYEFPIVGDFIGVFNFNGRWNDEFETASALLPAKLQPAFAIFNARMGVGDRDGRWRLELWAQNLTDTDYFQVGFNGPLQGSSGITTSTAPGFGGLADPYNAAQDSITYYAFLAPARTWGATLRFRY